MRIIPAILESGIEEVQQKLSLVDDLAELVQIDIMDGKFVPQKSVKPEELTSLKHKTLLEFHLMTEDPQSYFSLAQNLKIKRVFWHYEATNDIDSVIKEAKKYNFENGLAINPETSIDQISGIIDQFAAILFLGVNPGKQGQGFIPETIERIKKQRSLKPNLTIAVDGSVNEETFEDLKSAGVDDFVIGSALVKADDPKERFKFFQSLL